MPQNGRQIQNGRQNLVFVHTLALRFNNKH